ncbi:MAG: sporulation protein YqfC [Defluviitaleaceae bacterium]|nr:sporulation protein YqfC [Defluviitaleaceae bacterium]
MPKVKEKVANALSLPKEIALDLPVVTALGQGEVTIENYKSLLEFTETGIRIRTKAGVVNIAGRRLMLRQVTAENLLIAGQVTGIFFDDHYGDHS